MRKSQKRLMIFEVFIFIILTLNSFVSNILSNYYMILFLIFLIIIYHFILGFEKDRHVNSKDILLEVILFLLMYFLIYYLMGLIVGFAKTGNYYTYSGLKNFIIPQIFIIILTEFLRYGIIIKSENNKLLLTAGTIIFIYFDMSNIIYYYTYTSKYETFLFIALYLLPAISKNITCAYLDLVCGYKPIMFYLIVINIYPYLLPIVPNPSEYITSLIKLLVPILLMYRLHKVLDKYKDSFPERKEAKKVIYTSIPVICLMMVIIYLNSGYFHYYALAVASGSMSPNIKKGDVVIVEKINDYSKIKKQMVLAFKYENITIVHRIINIVKIDDKYYFYTKGDANMDKDNFVIEENMVIGIAKKKISYIGIPTVWLNEL